MLKKISCAGFKSFEEVNLDLNALNVLIGANGAGKSNLIQAFRLLESIVSEKLELFVRKEGGCNRILHHGMKISSYVELCVELEDTAYGCLLEPTLDHSLVFATEKIYRPDLNDSRPLADWPHISLGKGHQESKIHHPPSEFVQYTQKLSQTLASIRVYHFHDTSRSAKVRIPGYLYDNQTFKADGSNVAAFLFMLSKKHPRHYAMILKTVKRVAPFIGDFVLREKTDQQNQTILEWRDNATDEIYDINYLSDGTIRFICLTTLLLQPEPPVLILIDEPELGLHPSAIHLLAAMLQQAAKRTQVLVATQSPTLVSQLEPKDVIVVEQQDGQSTLHRLDLPSLETWLQDYTLGELWEKNVFGGKP